MTNNGVQTQSPFKGKGTSGEGFKTDIPSEDIHDARIVALIDLGTHAESFQGSPERDVRKCYLAFELDEPMSGMKSVNHVVARMYTMSFHEKSGLRQLCESILNDGNRLQDLDYEQLLGQPCTVQITHKKVDTDKGERTYVNITNIAAVSKKKRDQVFSPKRDICAWYIGGDLEDLPDYLPRIYGEELKDYISRSRELSRSVDDAPEDESRNETPF